MCGEVMESRRVPFNLTPEAELTVAYKTVLVNETIAGIPFILRSFSHSIVVHNRQRSVQTALIPSRSFQDLGLQARHHDIVKRIRRLTWKCVFWSRMSDILDTVVADTPARLCPFGPPSTIIISA